MFRALWFYQYHTWSNRLYFRLRRLKQPKYLFSSIIGIVYFYYYAGFVFKMRHAGDPSDTIKTISAFAFMMLLVLAWLLPSKKAGLGFNEAEIAILFPAPLTRKQVINFKLIGSQVPMLVGAFLLTLFRHGATSGHFFTRSLGWYVGLSIFSMHTTASSIAFSKLMDRGMTPKKRRITIFAIVALVAGGILFWARQTMPPVPPMQAPSPGDPFGWYQRYLDQVMVSGPLPYLLYPFRLITAPYFATSFYAFIVALGPALLIWLAHYWWLLSSDYEFSEGSIEQAERFSKMREARASGGGAIRQLKKAARAPFKLRPVGAPAIALLWKNLISLGQYVTGRFWLIIFALGVLASIIVKYSFGGDDSGIGIIVFPLLSVSLSLTLFSGPQLLRCDFRQDLKASDILKLFPMPGWQIVLGEVLAPAVILAAVQWLLISYALIFFPTKVDGRTVEISYRFGIALGAAIALPFVDLLAIITPNAFALYFPAWVQTGRDAPRGIETMGQRLILAIGQMLALIVGLIPPAIGFSVLFFPAMSLGFPMIGVVLGAIAAAVAMAVEAGIAIKILGGVFERFDLSGEQL